MLDRPEQRIITNTEPIRKGVSSVLVAFIVFYIVLFIFASPGMRDFSENIINGYSYSYTGKNEKHILHTSTGKEGDSRIVVDARIDSYMLDGPSIYIARRPIERYTIGNTPNSRILKICEYLVINTLNHKINKVEAEDINEFINNGLRCK